MKNPDQTPIMTSSSSPHLTSHAYLSEASVDTWHTDSGASEHINRIEWFFTMKEISQGIHTIQITDNTKLWVCERQHSNPMFD